MILNYYEESLIKNSELPPEWQSEKKLDDLEMFLQRNWEQRKVFYEDDKIGKNQQFLSFTAHRGIRTNEYIGAISFNGSQLNIFPKMFREEPDDDDVSDLTQNHLMHNLVKWLEYCKKIFYPFINISSQLNDENDLREFFVTLFVGYVKSAVERGLFYRYVDRIENLHCIKGKFDFADYFRSKIPNGEADRFLCTYSSFELDNQVNRIIKATCKLIYPTTSKRNQKIIRDVLIRMNEVSDVRCSPRDCDSIRLSKLHSNYKIIISMSKMFLLNKTSNYSIGNNESFCFLFPTNLLFEGFVGGFIQETLERFHGRTHLQVSDMHLIEDIRYGNESLGAAFTVRHDILATVNKKVFILDTKYKQISRFEGKPDEVKRIVSDEPKQTDIYQVCEYARKRNLNDVYLLYPMYRYENEEPFYPIARSKNGEGYIDIHFIRLPFVFEKNSDSTEKNLKNVILGIFGLK